MAKIFSMIKLPVKICAERGPMSLHIGLVRIGKQDSSPSLDILYDTTDSDRNHPVYASIIYDPYIGQLVEMLTKAGIGEYGFLIHAY